MISDVQLKKRNDEYDSIIRKVFGYHPSTALRKTLDEVNAKYDNEITRCFADYSVITGRVIVSRKCKEALNEFIIKSAKFMHEYLGFSISELPAICVSPYLHILEEEGRRNEAEKIMKMIQHSCTVSEICELDSEIENTVYTMLILI